MADTVLYGRADAVATITLNRPDAMNSLTDEMKVALRGALERAAADPAVRTVVVTGAGRAFCAGQDLREHADTLESDCDPAATVRLHYNPIIRAITSMPKPVVAAVNGVAAGAGASLAFACDFRLAAAKASFVMAFASVGFGPDSGMSWTLPRLVGWARATELLMLAQPVKPPRALEIGLVGSVVADDELDAAARELAETLATGPTMAYSAIKEALHFAAAHPLDQTLEKEAELQTRLAQTADHRNATLAFVRKERPSFTGR